MYYYELPAYKKALDLAVQIAESTRKIPIDFRSGYIVPIKLNAAKIAEKIAFADLNKENRSAFIDEATNILREVEISIRWLYDMRYLPKKGWCAIVRTEAELAKQLNGWKKATISNFESDNQSRE